MSKRLIFLIVLLLLILIGWGLLRNNNMRTTLSFEENESRLVLTISSFSFTPKYILFNESFILRTEVYEYQANEKLLVPVNLPFMTNHENTIGAILRELGIEYKSIINSSFNSNSNRNIHDFNNGLEEYLNDSGVKGNVTISNIQEDIHLLNSFEGFKIEVILPSELIDTLQNSLKSKNNPIVFHFKYDSKTITNTWNKGLPKRIGRWRYKKCDMDSNFLFVEFKPQKE